MPVSKKSLDLTSSSNNHKSGISEYWRSECGRAVVYVGDCHQVMRGMDSEQFHAVVTDPPYGLEFMGEEWDAPWKNGAGFNSNQQQDSTGRGSWAFGGTPSSQNRPCYGRDSVRYEEWFAERALEMVRVAKSGAHLLSFGGTRMWHRMACAVEDAGFEIRDTIMWVYGSGFPKSRNISKDIDRMMGAEREKTRTPMANESNVWMDKIGAKRPWKEQAKELGYHEHDGDEPVTDAAKQWDGWGTALKPAVEPIIVARKPFAGTIAQNVLQHGCGGINVDGCRVGSTGGTASIGEPNYLNKVYGDGMGGLQAKSSGKGRWPANLIHDGSEEVVELFPESKSSSAIIPLPPRPGDCLGTSHDRAQTEGYWGQGGGGYGSVGRSTMRGFDDEGSTARFFYTAKASDSDRPHGKGTIVHPTVKPLDLMRYLVRLVCAPGGRVLDPFMGSGSTGCAAVLEGMYFVGIEQSTEYADIAVGRLKLALSQAGPLDPSAAPAPSANGTGSQPLAVSRLRGA